jgi:hypothetical protein
MLCISNYLPLGLLCLLGCYASWAALPLGMPLGLLCLLGCFASWATSWATLPLGLLCLLAALPLGLPLGLLCLLGYFNMWPLGPCLIDIVCFDNAGILICLLGCAITGHLLVCKNDKLCYYAKLGYSVRPDMIRDMIFVSFEIAVSIYY